MNNDCAFIELLGIIFYIYIKHLSNACRLSFLPRKIKHNLPAVQEFGCGTESYDPVLTPAVLKAFC